MKFADDEKPPLVICSPGFIPAFKNGNRSSSRRQQIKRHKEGSQQAQSQWRVWLPSLLESLPNVYILNGDSGGKGINGPLYFLAAGKTPCVGTSQLETLGPH
jgi:hypothetical protein